MNDLAMIRPFAIATQCKNILADVLGDQRNGTRGIEENMADTFGMDWKRNKCLHAYFQLIVEKNYFQLPTSWNFKIPIITWGYLRCIDWNSTTVFNKVMTAWNEIKLEYNRIALWLYNDQGNPTRLSGGFLPIETVKGLIENREEKWKNTVQSKQNQEIGVCHLQDD